MIGRLLRSVDFERVLRTRSRAQSVHFAVHHLGDRPSRPHRPVRKAVTEELSTGGGQVVASPVDDSSAIACPEAPPVRGAVWLGAVIPKRHAKRSVTRSLLKRQIRAVVGDRSDSLAGGLWVVRLRAPFDRQQFVSAASEALKRSARAELEQLLERSIGRGVAPADPVDRGVVAR